MKLITLSSRAWLHIVNCFKTITHYFYKKLDNPQERKITTPQASNFESNLLDEAIAHHQSGDLEKAEKIYLQVLESNSRNFDALNFLGLVQYQRGHFSQSLEFLKQAISIYPANPVFYLNLGRTLERLDRLEDAFTVYKEAINLDSQFAEAYYCAGSVSQQRKEFDIALAYFDQAIERNDSLLDAYLSKNSIFCSIQEYEKALNALNQAISIHPNAAQLHLGLGLTYEERSEPGDLELAIASYTKAVMLRENYVSALFNRANVYQKLGLWDQAIKDYQAAIAQDLTFAPAHTNLGLAFYKKSDYESAVQSFENALRLDPTHAQTYSNLGVVLYESQKLIESLAAYEKAIQYKSDYFEAYSNRGNVLKELRQFEFALKSYDEAIAINNNFYEAYVNRGVVYFELNRLDKALADYDTAIKLNPDYALAYSNRSNVFKELGELPISLESIQKAIALKFDQLKNKPLERNVLSQKPMQVQDASIVLLELHSLLERNQISFFLAYGTLLGIYRDSELLPHDKDLDVGLNWDCSRDKLLQVLQQSGLYWIDPKSLNSTNNQYNFGVIEKRRGISIDFFFFKPEGSYFLSGFHHLPHPLLWRFNGFELGEITYKNKIFKVPVNPEIFLVDIYGINWRIPDPNFDSLVSGYNLVESSKPLSLIYAYSRLFDQLIEQNWKKAYGYCVQIRAFAQIDSKTLEIMRFLELSIDV